jgi:hypothetical protein
MNDNSSRSHVLFRLTIKRGFSPQNQSANESTDWESDVNTPTRVSVLNFVDVSNDKTYI